MVPMNTMFTLENNVGSFTPDAKGVAEAARSNAISEFIYLISKNVYTQEDFFSGFTNHEYFTETEIIKICKALDSNNKITCFTFGASGSAHKKHIPLICQLLKSNKTITSINLSGIDLGHNGLEETNDLKEIVRLLRTNKNITSLILSNTNIHDEESPMHEEQSVALLHLLITSTQTLLNLEIDGNNFSELSLNRIINALAKNSSLETLNLANIKALNPKLTQRLATINPKIKVNLLKHPNSDSLTNKDALLELYKQLKLERQKAQFRNVRGLERKQEFERKQEVEHNQALELKQGLDRPRQVLEVRAEIESKQLFEQYSGSGPANSSSGSEESIPIKKSLHPRDHLDFSKLLDTQALILAVRNRQCSQDNFTAAFQKLMFEGEELKALFKALNTNPEIHTLDFDFYESHKYDKQFPTICELLKTNTTIKNLILFLYGIGQNGLEVLVQMLKINRCILSLNLNWSGTGIINIAHFVREILLTNKNLTFLNVGRVFGDFAASDFRIILDGLSQNNTLQGIRFGSVRPLDGSPQKPELLELSRNHPSLTSIDLHSNRFNLKEMTTLTSVLQENSRIKFLDLSDIMIDDIKQPRADYIAESLAASKTLEYLAMNSIYLSNKILNALMKNTSLKRLEYYNEEIYPDNVTLFKLLKKHPSLESVRLPKIFSMNDMFDDLDEVCKVNKGIREFIINRGSIQGDEKKPYDAWYERLLKFLKEHTQITSIDVYYSDDMRNRYYKRIECQLYKNRNRIEEKNAIRLCLLFNLYKKPKPTQSGPGVPAMKPVKKPAKLIVSRSGPGVPAMKPAKKPTKLVEPRFQNIDINAINYLFSFLELNVNLPQPKKYVNNRKNKDKRVRV